MYANRHSCGLERTYCNRCEVELEVGQVGVCSDCSRDSAAPELLYLLEHSLECGIFDGSPVYKSDVIDAINKARGGK